MPEVNLKDQIPLISPQRFSDRRGFFADTYSRQKYADMGVDVEFVQDSHSLSHDVGTLRGLHFQAPPNAQGKLVRCGRGAIFDVVVDIRQGSATFKKWCGYHLSAMNGHQIYVPVGFAHGFMVLEPESEIIYKFTDYYAPATQGVLRWDDPELEIEWPFSVNPIISDKDAIAPILKDFESPFVFGQNS